MFQKFNELFNALNNEALRSSDADLTDLESAMRSVLTAWTYYLNFTGETLSAEEKEALTAAIRLVLRW